MTTTDHHSGAPAALQARVIAPRRLLKGEAPDTWVLKVGRREGVLAIELVGEDGIASWERLGCDVEPATIVWPGRSRTLMVSHPLAKIQAGGVVGYPGLMVRTGGSVMAPGSVIDGQRIVWADPSADFHTSLPHRIYALLCATAGREPLSRLLAGEHPPLASDCIAAVRARAAAISHRYILVERGRAPGVWIMTGPDRETPLARISGITPTFAGLLADLHSFCVAEREGPGTGLMGSFLQSRERGLRARGAAPVIEDASPEARTFIEHALEDARVLIDLGVAQ